MRSIDTITQLDKDFIFQDSFSEIKEFKMPSHIERMRTLEAIRRSPIHQSISSPSSRIAMISRNSISSVSALNDPAKALDTIRAIVQKDITEKVKVVVQKYVDEFFAPAIENVKKNLGEENIDAEGLMERVCLDAIDHAKGPFIIHKPAATALSVIKGIIPSLTIEPAVLKKPLPPEPPEPLLVPISAPAVTVTKRSFGDLILVTKQGKPVRREGLDWDPGRLNADTLFILGSKANKALGLGQTRGRLYMKHPELFKYSGDQVIYLFLFIFFVLFGHSLTFPLIFSGRQRMVDEETNHVNNRRKSLSDGT